MANPQSDNAFDYDLTERLRSRAAPKVQRYRVDDMVAVVTVPTLGRKGLAGLDRSMLGLGSDFDLRPIGGQSTQVKAAVKSGTQVSYEAHLLGTPNFQVDLVGAAQSREDKLMKAGMHAILSAARGLFRMVSALFTGALYAGRTSTLAAVSGGDGKHLGDATCDIIRNLRAAKRAARASNDGIPPNRLIMSREDLDVIVETNTAFRALIRDTSDGVVTAPAARKLLKAILEMDIVVKDAPSAGTNMWSGKMALVHVPSDAPIEPYAGDQPGGTWNFPGMGMTQADTADIEFEELTTAALILQEFPSNVIEVQANGDPQTWAATRWRPTPFVEDVGVALAPAPLNLDITSAWLLTATQG